MVIINSALRMLMYNSSLQDHNPNAIYHLTCLAFRKLNTDKFLILNLSLFKQLAQ